MSRRWQGGSRDDLGGAVGAGDDKLFVTDGLLRDANQGVSRRFVGQHVGIRLGEVVRLI